MSKKKQPIKRFLGDSLDIARSDTAFQACGAPATDGQPCVLPARHNMGQSDAPWNHVSQVEKDRTMNGFIAELDAMAKTEPFPEHKDDAWRKLHVLVDENTKEWTPRPNLLVEALGCDRAVRLTLIETRHELDALDKRRKVYHSSGKRNVSTMRELAQAILDACDFVEAVNPKWAENA